MQFSGLLMLALPFLPKRAVSKKRYYYWSGHHTYDPIWREDDLSLRVTVYQQRKVDFTTLPLYICVIKAPCICVKGGADHALLLPRGLSAIYSGGEA